MSGSSWLTNEDYDGFAIKMRTVQKKLDCGCIWQVDQYGDTSFGLASIVPCDRPQLCVARGPVIGEDKASAEAFLSQAHHVTAHQLITGEE
jgi:hypothetical protein